MTRKLGNNASSYWRTFIDYSVTSTTNTSVTIQCTIGLWISKPIPKNDQYTMDYDKISLTINGKTYTFSKKGNIYSTASGDGIPYGTKTITITKTKVAQTISIVGKINHAKGASYYKGTSTASGSVSVAARPKYTIRFSKGLPVDSADVVTNMPSDMTKYYGYDVTLPTNKPLRDGYVFSYWLSPSGGGNSRNYDAGEKFTYDTNVILTAIWSIQDPPTLTMSAPVFKVGGDEQTSDTIIRNFTDVSVDVSDITVYHDRELSYVRLGIKTANETYYSADKTTLEDGTLTIKAVESGVPTFTQADDGSAEIFVEVADKVGVKQGAYKKYSLGTWRITAPVWEHTFEVAKSSNKEPSKNTSDEWIFDNLYVGKDYDNGAFTTYEPASTVGYAASEDSTKWYLTFQFTEDYVSNAFSETPDVSLKIEYKHYDIFLSEQRGAFYSTTRQLNYSNGIYNQEFISGVDTVQYSGLASRAWWCEYNNPLYFPDTNYLEAGSNDTAIMGLTKVGDYLGIIKQSKTTDTAIYLAYPTSFESDTTYAVKQGVQGVGAIAKYSFNILGDESLFLSPNGVCAIVPSEDSEHKTQNRSYFLDGRLLDESELEYAYSFVFDGMYYLAIGNGNVYVLDGNQRNSWGNDKTNLVYEGYFLQNIPATCMVKMNGRLVFSNENEVCAFTDEYVDAYDMETGDETVPVKAEWSTVFDDDNALHYYKTMQKKGNLISILPIENEMPYKEVLVDAETFNADKELYWTFNGEKYIQCTEESVYDPEETYYIENRTKTKVYVRKDDKPEVEIQRSFNLQSEIPSEMFFKKKFKKYKRLQFIIKNEAGEDFGIDCIVKNYSVGNYAKR